jgi:hypothetical protein
MSALSAFHPHHEWADSEQSVRSPAVAAAVSSVLPVSSLEPHVWICWFGVLLTHSLDALARLWVHRGNQP